MYKVVLSILALTLSTSVFARNIFLNGKDISSAKGQKLDKVNIFISENGDIFITAPQYQVFEEKTFVPLTKTKVADQNSHPAGLPTAKAMTEGEAPVSELPENTQKPQDSTLIEKAGTRFID